MRLRFMRKIMKTKQALGAVIEQLMANPKNFAGISDEQLSLVIDFAPQLSALFIRGHAFS